MGNVLGEVFDEFVNRQIEVRQEKLSTQDNRDEELIWLNTSTAFIRLASGVDVDTGAMKIDPNDSKKQIPDDLARDAARKLLEHIGDTTLAGSELAKKLVLLNGVTSYGTQALANYNSGDESEPADYDKMTAKSPNVGIRSPIAPNLWEGAYGFGGTEFGYRPMPGINTATISFYNNGSLKKAVINIKAFNLRQLEIIDILYMKLGYTILLEYGHNVYYDNKKELIRESYLNTECFDKFFDKKAHQFDLLKAIKREREKRDGNFDAFFGRVSKFDWSFAADGTYDINIEAVSLGDVIESLKSNISNPFTKRWYPEEKIKTEQEVIDEIQVEADIAEQQFASSQGYHDIDKTYIANDSISATVNSGGEGITRSEILAAQQAQNEASLANLAVEKVELEERTRIGEVIGLEPEQVKAIGESKTANFNYNVTILDKWLSDLADNINLRKVKVKQIPSDPPKEYTKHQYTPGSIYDYYVDHVFKTNEKGPNAKGVLLKRAYIKYWFWDKTSGEEFFDGNTSQYYVKLGFLLKFIQDNLLIYNADKVPLFNIDHEFSSNYMLTFPHQYSANPNICIIPPGTPANWVETQKSIKEEKKKADTRGFTEKEIEKGRRSVKINLIEKPDLRDKALDDNLFVPPVLNMNYTDFNQNYVPPTDNNQMFIMSQDELNAEINSYQGTGGPDDPVDLIALMNASTEDDDYDPNKGGIYVPNPYQTTSNQQQQPSQSEEEVDTRGFTEEEIKKGRRSVKVSIVEKPGENISILGMPIPFTGTIGQYFMMDRGHIKSGNKKGQTRVHYGVDMAIASGTTLRAPADGVIKDAGFKPNNKDGTPNACGGTLYIQHYGKGGDKRVNDSSYNLQTRYCHLKDIWVKEGESVKRGQAIGKTGGGKDDLGRGRSSGPHLHYEVYDVSSPKKEYSFKKADGTPDIKKTYAIDPKPFLNSDLTSEEVEEMLDQSDLPSPSSMHDEMDLHGERWAELTKVVQDITGDDFHVEGNPYVGRLMHVHVNMQFISNLMIQGMIAIKESGRNRGKIAIYSFLQSLMDGIGEALGGINEFQVTYDHDTNTAKITDQSYLNYINCPFTERTRKAPVKFNLYGLKNNMGSFITDCNFNVTISPEFSTQITVGAQANANVVGENATGLSQMNIGLTDRMIPEKWVNEFGHETKDATKETVMDPVKWSQFFNANLSQCYRTYVGRYIDAKNIEILSARHADLSGKCIGWAVEDKYIPAPFFLPFTLRLSMNGLGGMKTFQKFTTTDDILPSSYRTDISGKQVSKVNFLIRGLNHEINGNKWTTTLEALTVPPSNLIAIPPHPKRTDLKKGDDYKKIPKSTYEEGSRQDRIISAMKYLVEDKKMKADAAAGLVGNLLAESGLETSNLERSGEACPTNGNYVNKQGGNGIAQWTGSRRTKFETAIIGDMRYTVSNRTDYENAIRYHGLEAQLDFLLEEMETSYKPSWNALNSSKDSAKVSRIIVQDFERPASYLNTKYETRRTKAGISESEALKTWNKEAQRRATLSNEALTDYENSSLTGKTS